MRLTLSLLCMATVSLGANAGASGVPEPTPRSPNILLIVADDLGIADIGAYGSEIPTPNIDQLARHGLQLTNFHVAQTCSLSRAMLMSGTDAHLAGLGSMAETMVTTRDKRLGKPGYEGYLSQRVAALPEVLQAAGYRTYMAGKWHLGSDEHTNPAARGFQRSFALLDGGASHLNGLPLVGPPAQARYRENGSPAKVPANFYSTRFYTEKLIEYLSTDRDDSRPFFAYLALTAPHWPLQAPAESIARFRGRYDKGYEWLHAQRVARAKMLGLIPRDLAAAPLPITAPRWERLGKPERKVESRKMEIYAAMVGDMDQYAGQIIDYLKATDQYESTIIIFVSDNGPEGTLFESNSWGALAQWVAACCDNSFENMGQGNSYLWLGPGWAWASAAPYRGLKGSVLEGGLRVPAIVHYPARVSQGARSDAFATIMDVMPTLLEAAEIAVPGEQFQGRSVLPMRGGSMWPLLVGADKSIHHSDYAVGWELWGLAGLQHGNLKIVSTSEPGLPRWQLFDLAVDPVERHDLSATRPRELQRLEALWQQYVKDVGLLSLDTTQSGEAR